MAKKKAARPARKGRASKNAARKASAVRRPAKRAAKAARKPAATKKAKKKAAPARKTARAKAKAPARVTKKVAPLKARASKPVKKARPQPKPVAAKVAPPSPAAKKVAPKAAGRAAKRANIDRPRRTVAEIHGVPSSLDMDREASAARSGRAELEHKIQEHTSTSPALTAGDVDADWASAESVGDEAPGGDNPTPDQDVVDDIGRALGVEYDDDEELQGGDEIAERDRHRWELDPGSSDDFEER
jgi:hypothetical protein